MHTPGKFLNAESPFLPGRFICLVTGRLPLGFRMKEGSAVMGSIPNIPFVNFDVVFSANFTEFVLKWQRVMVNLLVIDVVN